MALGWLRPADLRLTLWRIGFFGFGLADLGLALALQAAGCFAIVFEAIPARITEALMPSMSIPVIGIGAGPHCSGQIQVMHDVLGMFPHFVPRHAKQYAQLATEMQRAFETYRQEVMDGTFPDEEHSFT